eukprot:sb/3466459/
MPFSVSTTTDVDKITSFLYTHYHQGTAPIPALYRQWVQWNVETRICVVATNETQHVTDAAEVAHSEQSEEGRLTEQKAPVTAGEVVHSVEEGGLAGVAFLQINTFQSGQAACTVAMVAVTGLCVRDRGSGAVRAIRDEVRRMRRDDQCVIHWSTNLIPGITPHLVTTRYAIPLAEEAWLAPKAELLSHHVQVYPTIQPSVPLRDAVPAEAVRISELLRTSQKTFEKVITSEYLQKMMQFPELFSISVHEESSVIQGVIVMQIFAVRGADGLERRTGLVIALKWEQSDSVPTILARLARQRGCQCVLVNEGSRFNLDNDPGPIQIFKICQPFGIKCLPGC